jgi:hypothetical protein
VDEFRLSPDGKTIAYVLNEDGASRLRLLDTGSGQRKTLESLPIGIISDIEWHNNSVDFAFNFKSPRTPNDVYSLDTATLKSELWSKSVTGGLDKVNERSAGSRAAGRIDEFRRLRQGHCDGVSIRERRGHIDVRRRELPAALVNSGERVIVGVE